MKHNARLLLVIFLLSLFVCQPVLASRAIVKKVKDFDHSSGRLGTYKALVIGIDTYDDPTIPDLQTAVRDARAMADVLRKSYGFETRLLLNRQVTRESLYNSLRRLASESEAEDSILIYYAGHGDLDRQYNDGWWIPADAKGGNPVSYFDNVQIQKAMRSMKARHVLLISDSCYSGSLFGSSRAVPPVIDEKYYLRLYNEKSRWGITSGNKEPVEDSGTDGHSIFAYQLLKELRSTEKKVFTTQELYTRIAPIIGNNSEQTPLCRPIRNTGDQGGEFVFVRMTGGVSGSEAGNYKPVVSKAVGSLRVKSNPTGAKVFIGGNVAGETPVELGDIKPGNKRVRVEKSGYRAEEKSVHVRAGARKIVSFELEQKVSKAWLTVLASPADARVRILNIDPRYSAGMALAPGRYHVEVSSSGYEMKQQWIALAVGDDLDVDITLQKAQATPGRSFTDPATGMEFVWVAGGCYQMGDTFGDGDSDEKPVHEVCVDGFYMGKYEVTEEEYEKIAGSNPSNDPKGDNYPVEMVSWNDAQSFIAKLNNRSGKNYRLPTEAEWEYAARSGGKKEKYAGSNSVDSVAWYYSNSGVQKHQVGTQSANGLGLYDMSGNLWEWCSDWYASDYYKSSPRDNPQGASSGSNRVSRGGSWLSGPAGVRAAYRDGSGAADRLDNLGFRLVSPRQ